MARGKPNPLMLGVLGVAVAALVTDRFLTSANASEDTGVVEGTVQSDVVGEALAEPVGDRPTLAERFSEHASDGEGDIAAAFAPIQVSKPDTVAGVQEPSKDAPGLRLTAVLRRADGDIAVINGRPLRAGQAFDGGRVLSIRDREVRVHTSVGPITLRLDQPALGGR